MAKSKVGRYNTYWFVCLLLPFLPQGRWKTNNLSQNNKKMKKSNNYYTRFEVDGLITPAVIE